MAMAGRRFTASGGNYKFGYQGSEKESGLYDDEGAAYTTDNRMLDSRLGRWMTIDPVDYPWQSPYASMNNNPVVFTDPLGLEGGKTTGDGTPDYTYYQDDEGGDDIARFDPRAGGNSPTDDPTGGDIQEFVGGTTVAQLTKNIGNAVGQTDRYLACAGGGIGDLFGSSTSGDGWKDLDKETLRDYTKGNHPLFSKGELENYIGRIFEMAWNQSFGPIGADDNYTPNTERMSGGGRTTVPDATASGRINMSIIVPRAAWFEVKAKDGNIYNSTSSGQIKGHITNLAASVPRFYRFYGNKKKPASAASLTIVTTSGVSISPKVYILSGINNIALYHYTAQYSMVGNVMSIRFKLTNGLLYGLIGDYITPPVILRR